MRAVSKETEKFNFFIDSFKQDRMDPYEDANAKNELHKWFKIKMLSFKDGMDVKLDKPLLAKILRERTETTALSVDNTLADKILKAANALCDDTNDKDRDSYISEVLTIKNWFEDHLDEPDSHLLGLTVDDEVISMMEKHNATHNIFEQLADNNIKYSQRGRIVMKSYESWRVMRKGSIVIIKEKRIFGRVAKDCRIINENTILEVFPNRDENKSMRVSVKDIILMPTDSVNPSNYPSNNCGLLVKDREKQMLNEVLESFEQVLSEGLKAKFDIDRGNREVLTRMDLQKLTKSYTIFSGMPRDARDNFARQYAGILKQKIETKKMEFGMEKGYVYYPSWKRERMGINLDEYKWIIQKLDEWKIDLQGCKGEVEKQTTTLLQQLSVDGFNERRDLSIKNSFISYLKKFGFIPESFDDQVAMKCPKSIETIYSNKLILDKVLMNLNADPEFDAFLQNEIKSIRIQSDNYIKKLVVVLNELLNSQLGVPTDYDAMIQQAKDYAAQHPSDPNSKGYARIVDTYSRISYKEPLPGTPLNETPYGRIALSVFYSMQNEFASVYNMWGYEAFYKFHKELVYESKSEHETSSWAQSIQQQLKFFETRKF